MGPVESARVRERGRERAREIQRAYADLRTCSRTMAAVCAGVAPSRPDPGPSMAQHAAPRQAAWYSSTENG